MSLFESIVNDAVAEFKVNFLKAFKERNTIKVSISDPLKKKVLSYPIDQAIFAKAFGTELGMVEKMPELNVRFKMPSAHRVVDIFGISPIMIFNKHGDIGLALPAMSVSRDINHEFKKGDLVMPISEYNGIIKIFVPGGCDEEKAMITKAKPF